MGFFDGPIREAGGRGDSEFTEADMERLIEKVMAPPPAPVTLTSMEAAKPAAFDPGPTMRTPAGRNLYDDGQDRLEAELRAKMIVAEENARDAREAYERAVQRRQSSSPSH
jgi:hypothetical protein